MQHFGINIVYLMPNYYYYYYYYYYYIIYLVYLHGKCIILNNFFSYLFALDFLAQNDVQFVKSIMINTRLYECLYITQRL